MANPNPSPETRFKPGQSGNPSGKSTEVQLLEQKAALSAVKLRHWALSSLQEKMEAGTLTLDDVLNPDTLRLFKDSEDRAHGTPKAVTEIGGEGGGPVKLAIQRTIVDPQE